MAELTAAESSVVTVSVGAESLAVAEVFIVAIVAGLTMSRTAVRAGPGVPSGVPTRAESVTAAVKSVAVTGLAVAAESLLFAAAELAEAAAEARGVVGGRPLAICHSRMLRLIAARVRVRWRLVCLGGATHATGGVVLAGSEAR